MMSNISHRDNSLGIAGIGDGRDEDVHDPTEYHTGGTNSEGAGSLVVETFDDVDQDDVIADEIIADEDAIADDDVIEGRALGGDEGRGGIGRPGAGSEHESGSSSRSEQDGVDVEEDLNGAEEDYGTENTSVFGCVSTVGTPPLILSGRDTPQSNGSVGGDDAASPGPSEDLFVSPPPVPAPPSQHCSHANHPPPAAGTAERRKQQQRREIHQKFGKFDDVKTQSRCHRAAQQDFDENISLVSETWSTDVLAASDTEASSSNNQNNALPWNNSLGGTSGGHKNTTFKIASIPESPIGGDICGPPSDIGDCGSESAWSTEAHAASEYEGPGTESYTPHKMEGGSEAPPTSSPPPSSYASVSKLAYLQAGRDRESLHPTRPNDSTQIACTVSEARMRADPPPILALPRSVVTSSTDSGVLSTVIYVPDDSIPPAYEEEMGTRPDINYNNHQQRTPAPQTTTNFQSCTMDSILLNFDPLATTSNVSDRVTNISERSDPSSPILDQGSPAKNQLIGSAPTAIRDDSNVLGEDVNSTLSNKLARAGIGDRFKLGPGSPALSFFKSTSFDSPISRVQNFLTLPNRPLQAMGERIRTNFQPSSPNEAALAAGPSLTNGYPYDPWLRSESPILAAKTSFIKGFQTLKTKMMTLQQQSPVQNGRSSEEPDFVGTSPIDRVLARGVGDFGFVDDHAIQNGCPTAAPFPTHRNYDLLPSQGPLMKATAVAADNTSSSFEARRGSFHPYISASYDPIATTFSIADRPPPAISTPSSSRDRDDFHEHLMAAGAGNGLSLQAFDTTDAYLDEELDMGAVCDTLVAIFSDSRSTTRSADPTIGHNRGAISSGTTNNGYHLLPISGTSSQRFCDDTTNGLDDLISSEIENRLYLLDTTAVSALRQIRHFLRKSPNHEKLLALRNGLQSSLVKARAYYEYLCKVKREALNVHRCLEHKLITLNRRWNGNENFLASLSSQEFCERHVRAIDIFAQEFRKLATPDEKTDLMVDFAGKLRLQLTHFFSAPPQSTSPASDLDRKLPNDSEASNPYFCSRHAEVMRYGLSGPSSHNDRHNVGDDSIDRLYVSSYTSLMIPADSTTNFNISAHASPRILYNTDPCPTCSGSIEFASHQSESACVDEDQVTASHMLWPHVERHLYTRVFGAAMYPNGDVDLLRDQLFSRHIARLASTLGHDHKYLKIPKKHLRFYPWQSAQNILTGINVAVSPLDKLCHVVRACKVIARSLCHPLATSSSSSALRFNEDTCDDRDGADGTLYGTVASADDLVPVLVYVVIHSNPGALLSNVQFIEQYHFRYTNDPSNPNVTGGEVGYWWTQFRSVVEFIKTMEYENDVSNSAV